MAGTNVNERRMLMPCFARWARDTVSPQYRHYLHGESGAGQLYTEYVCLIMRVRQQFRATCLSKAWCLDAVVPS